MEDTTFENPRTCKKCGKLFTPRKGFVQCCSKTCQGNVYGDRVRGTGATRCPRCDSIPDHRRRDEHSRLEAYDRAIGGPLSRRGARLQNGFVGVQTTVATTACIDDPLLDPATAARADALRDRLTDDWGYFETYAKPGERWRVFHYDGCTISIGDALIVIRGVCDPAILQATAAGFRYRLAGGAA